MTMPTRPSAVEPADPTASAEEHDAGVAAAGRERRTLFVLEERLRELEVQSREQSETRWTLDLEMRSLIDALAEKRVYIAQLEERIRVLEGQLASQGMTATATPGAKPAGYQLVDAVVARVRGFPVLYPALRSLARRWQGRARG